MLDRSEGSLRMIFLSRELHDVTGQEALDARRALLLGIIRVTPREYPALACLNLDLASEENSLERKELIGLLLQECSKMKWDENIIAYRGRARFRPAFESINWKRLHERVRLFFVEVVFT